MSQPGRDPDAGDDDARPVAPAEPDLDEDELLPDLDGF